jgi:cytochrome c oxidase subunit 2
MGSGGVLDPHGPVAGSIEGLWWLTLWLGLAVFVVFAAFLARALFRRRREDEPERAGRIDRWFLVWGVAGPLVVLAVVFAATVNVMRTTPHEAPDDALVVEVVGHQFFYEVRYPDSGVTTTDELHLPVGQPVALELTSADVIHSFWVPALAGKRDMLPSRINTLVVEADRTGRHTMRCAEFCGLDHANMSMTVVVEEPAAFEQWLATLAAGEGG